MQTSATEFPIIPSGETTASKRIVTQNFDWKNNGVESHGETQVLAVLCEYHHVARKTTASDYIVSQNSVWKNNKQRDQVDLPALYKNRSQTRRFSLFSIVYHVATTRLPTFRRRDVPSGPADGRILPVIATEWQHRATEALRLVLQNLQMPGMKIAIKRQLQAKLNLLTPLKEQVRTASTSVLVMNGPGTDTTTSTYSMGRRQVGVQNSDLHRHRVQPTSHDYSRVPGRCRPPRHKENTRRTRQRQRHQSEDAVDVQLHPSGRRGSYHQGLQHPERAFYPATDLSVWFRRFVVEPLLKDMDEFEKRGSGWTLHSIVNLAINANKHNPMRGSSYVELPDIIKKRGAYINVRN